MRLDDNNVKKKAAEIVECGVFIHNDQHFFGIAIASSLTPSVFWFASGLTVKLVAKLVYYSK
jgi:hypothetical protein